MGEQDGLALRVSTLLDIVTEVHRARSLEALAETVAGRAKWLLDFDYGEMWCGDARVSRATPGARPGEAAKGEEEKVDEDVARRILASGAPIRRTTPADEGNDESPPSRDEIALPLRGQDGALGLLWIVERGRRFTDLDLMVLRLFVIQLSAAAESVARQAKLRELNADLERTQESRDRLTAMVIHDLRNPLHAAIGALSLLANAREPEQRQRWHEIVELSLESIGTMVEDLLTIRRLAAGALPIERETLDLGGLVERKSLDFAPRAESAGKTLVAEGTDSAWLVLEADRSLLSRVLDNLLSNAVKHTGGGGSIRVRARGEDEEIVLEVEDDGPGVPEEKREAIFEEFVQSDDEKRSGGFGLGLAFCRLAVEAHGGTIRLVSAAPGGACFRVVLPRASNRDERGEER